MKSASFLAALLLLAQFLTAQIIRPQLKAGFGIEGDLEASRFGTGNTDDDWFSRSATGTGLHVIDTNGSAELRSRYISQPSTLNHSFAKTMSRDVFSLLNGNRWMDAVFVRDFHGDDSTVFASGGNKNGQSPAVWSTPISQSVPDKTEILDVFMHVRRGGPTSTDSLWMFGGVSIENTNGNRYFDFEMYQSPIAYDRNNMRFTGYGPDAGHTSWKFDGTGRVVQAGDIILTAEYSSSSLTLIEARIWIKKEDLSIVPANFIWAGDFDGAGSAASFGYASILPATSGAFYSGLQNEDPAWGGPFGIVRSNNSVVADYTPGQFMEFSVNLTKLGLDPVTLLGGSSCDRPFKRVMVKSRASTSFTSELKDFVAPFDYLNPPPVNIFTDVPIFCGVISVSNIRITNPLSTSTYTWHTPDGRFADSSNPTSVYVDRPGTYIVHQQLQAGCPYFASDTVVIEFDSTCGVVAAENLDFRGVPLNNRVQLFWNRIPEFSSARFLAERSKDGIRFTACDGKPTTTAGNEYSLDDLLPESHERFMYYRLKIIAPNNTFRYSAVIRVARGNSDLPEPAIYPNPATHQLQIDLQLAASGAFTLELDDCCGSRVLSRKFNGTKGRNRQQLEGLGKLPNGLYTLKIAADGRLHTRRIVVQH